jgi:hypothetical protein
MEKFIIVVSGESESSVEKFFMDAVKYLRSNPARKVVPVLPHAILFEFDGSKAAAFKELKKCSDQSVDILLFHLYPGFVGSLKAEAAKQVEAFFQG